ncbi:plasmid pRiA4b ORF-3 family protein [Candidatus Poriferisodalis sp.]|uniref:plasmid pRiA4b ORF-3 family protein n=1 Tax=Candidatus Poriferisodalis sp. TaxID=3101277 RepID=UPI003AF6FB99
MSAARTSEPEEMPLFDLLITLDGAHVQVDRRVLVPGQATLGDLHVVIQLAMGWQDCHLHAFTDRSGTTYGDTTLSDLDFAEESKVRVSEVLAERGDEIEYEYDFGDSWHHRIELVKIRPDEGQGIRGLACIGGHGLCPPEDCGGIWSYAEMCEALADPRHRDHEEMVEWMREIQEQPFNSSQYDPNAFDLEAANEAVRTLLGRP